MTRVLSEWVWSFQSFAEWSGVWLVRPDILSFKRKQLWSDRLSRPSWKMLKDVVLPGSLGTIERQEVPVLTSLPCPRTHAAALRSPFKLKKIRFLFFRRRTAWFREATPVYGLVHGGGSRSAVQEVRCPGQMHGFENAPQRFQSTEKGVSHTRYNIIRWTEAYRWPFN